MSDMTRRAFVAMSAATFAAAALSRRATAKVRDDSFLDWKPQRDTAFAAYGYGGNSLALRGKDGGVLIDCKNAPFGAALRREAAARVGALRAVINTHHHADHTGGNHAFITDVPTFAHEKATPRILGQMNRYIAQAKEAATQWGDRTGPAIDQVKREALDFYRGIEKAKATDFAPRTGVPDTHSLDVAGVKLELRHFGPGHTDNDLVVYVPSLNILHAGDLLFAGMHPFVDQSAGGNTVGWSAAARKAAELCDDKTIVIPGHGEVTTVAALREQAEYFENVREVVTREMKAGKSRKEIAEMNHGLYALYAAPTRRSMTLMAIYDELKAEQAK